MSNNPAPPAINPAPATNNPAPAIVVTAPIMGGLSSDLQNVWTGGQPNHSWTALVSTAAQDPETPHQLRLAHVGHTQKTYTIRKSGLDTNFEDKHNFVRFIDQVWQHLKDTGMDIITYLPDSESPTMMVSVVHGHSCFALDYTKLVACAPAVLYDKHDKLNDKGAKLFLLDLVDIKLQTRLKQCTSHGRRSLSHTLDAACDSHPFDICGSIQRHQERDQELTPSTVFRTGHCCPGWQLWC
jgi:hypothetical protein